ncbi:ATP-binding sensor histidine kinase [Bradyrhizobium sp. AZCC 2262]|uniref:ATP-binding sensor histidine kinase n=1 Tax=Bradyrhizobium sp. AZCC 2262 TaxID=3117022 RepID=UPI002FEFCB93
MVPHSLNVAYSDGESQVLWEDGERVFRRGWRLGDDGKRRSVLLVVPAADYPSRSNLDRLTHEYELKDELDRAWAVRPLDLVRDTGRTILVLEDEGSEPFDRLLGAPMEVGRFLRLAIPVAAALGRLHQRGLVHKDIKPANILRNDATGEVRLTGFGIASRFARERQSPHPPETIAGTLAYMAPEQTGRMNRSIDSRSDLYALGVTFYQMLTGVLPFNAADPMELIHYHIARQPVPPCESVPSLPRVISDIVMKLLAKSAEDRYQTATGIAHDLRHCLTEWETRGLVDCFPLGQQDAADRLLIPEKLYGRTSEIETLLAAFDRVVQGGAPELVLVSGYSGIGKSVVVNELHKVLVPQRGLFATGKFDQYKRDIPYSTLAQAFQGLVRPLLAKRDVELGYWRDAFRESMGPHGQLMVDLVPDLKLIIGEQEPLPELPPQDAQRRFFLVFRRFLAVLARSEHPLALFLDDLQWLDAATLELLEHLLTEVGVRHLLLIGAYRDNEVTPAHPLMRTLDRIRSAGAQVQEIVLAPFANKHVVDLIADSIRCDRHDVAPLAALVHAKTAGNPFFVVQFLSALVEEGLLTFDHSSANWSWDLAGIHGKGYTDNVVDLMIGKLSRLPASTQKILQRLACLGSTAEFAQLAMVREESDEELRHNLQEALRSELVLHSGSSYRFLHDRVQEAAYSLIPEARRAEAHLRIGRLLAVHTAPEEREEAIFEIVNQLNRGATLIAERIEKEQLADFNLMAGKRAKASTAYVSALRYFIAGAAVMPDDAWERRPDLMFALELHRAECEFLTGALTVAEERLTMLTSRAATIVDHAALAGLRIELYLTANDVGRAVEVCLGYLRHLGIEWSAHPTADEARQEYERIWSLLEGREIEALVDLPIMADPEALGTMEVLTKVTIAAMNTDVNLYGLVVCRMVNLSLEHGNNEASCVAYVCVGAIAERVFGQYKAGFRFGQLGYDLVERRSLKRFQVRTYLDFVVLIIPWTKHLRTGQDLFRRVFDAANDVGEIMYATYACLNLNHRLLAIGDPLPDVQREAEKGLEFTQKAGVTPIVDVIATQLAFIRNLRGFTTSFGCFDDGKFNELEFEGRSHPPTTACWYWARKLQARVLAGDYAAAADAWLKAKELLWASPSFFEAAEARFYGALSQAASSDRASPDDIRQRVQAVSVEYRMLAEWAENCSENFESRTAIVGAEMARIENRELDAERLYEKAIRSARTNGFVHIEGLANELAARFYAARDVETIANAYLREARSCYLRWGADGKVRQLDQLHPSLRQDQHAPGLTGTIEAPVDHLDLATIVEVSQALSGEIVVDRLIDRFMRAAIEHAGAERAVLVAVRDEELRTSAEAVVRGNEITLQVRQHPASDVAALPESLVLYSIRTREPVVLGDAVSRSSFSADPYIVKYRVHSVLCLPLINQGKLIGILYLENNLTPHAFTPDRVTMLKVLASQAAISLENTQLYRDLADREGKIRRLVDANIIGIIVADAEGGIFEANDAFLHILGFDRNDFASGNVRWNELTPPEWRDRTARALEELLTTGTAQPFEKEYFRKDGSRVPVLIGYTAFEEKRDKGIAFVLDLTERKRAENALRESEERFRDFAETASDWLWEMGPDHKLTMLTPNAFGSSPSARLGTAAWERALDLEAEPEKWRAIQATMDSHEPFRDFVYLAAGFDGSPMYVRASGKPVFNVDGKFLGYRGTGTDATVIIRAQEALRESERNLRSAIDGIPGLVAILAPNGDVEAVNRQIFEYCGQSLEELRNWGTNGTIHPDDHPQLAEIFTKSIAAGIPYRTEARVRRFDGQYRWFEIRGIPVREASSDRIVRWYSLLTDTEDRTQALARLQQMQSDFAHMNRVSMMGELAASLSHEIAQPIASARNNARAAQNFLERQPQDMGEVREALSCVVGDADRAGEIIDRIREQIKKAPPRKECFDLNAAIDEVIALAQSVTLRDGISVQTRLAEGLLSVLGDRVQLQQVLLNLILNAAEAMSSVEEGARELVISTEHHLASALVAVCDSGPGIGPAHLDRVFDAFYTTKSSGTGMGLSICRSIIDAHGGKLWAEANDPRGAAFKFKLPDAERELTTPAQASQRS